MTYIEKFWRPATDKDVARVMAGETVEARFRDDEANPWCSHGNLTGFEAVSENKLRWFTRTASWRFCQVYAPPQWFLEKPEPGEGYRLLGKFPDEPRQPKDDVYVDGTWRTTEGCGPQPETLWYRRRIEPPKPEPKHYVLQVGDTVETPSGHLIKIVDRPTEQMHYALRVGDTADVPSGHRIAITEHGVEVT